MTNLFVMDREGKRLGCTFKMQEFWKCIGCVLSAVNYGKKGNRIWSETQKSFCRMTPTKLGRYVRENTNLYKLCCDHYHHVYIYACH